MLSRTQPLNGGLVAYTYWKSYDGPLFLLVMGIITFLMWGGMRLRSLSLSKRLAQRQSTAIAALAKEAQLVTAGYKNRIDLHTDDEFESLAEQLNQMLLAVNRLYKRLMAVEKESLLFEKKMLEAQFNPHFLYNTLETIRVTMTIDPRIAEQLIYALNRILRYSLNADKTEGSLGEDMAVLEDYLSVYQIRFEHLTSHMAIDEQLESLKVPRLFLLPLVENSIKYGLKSRKDLAIVVKAYQRAGRFFVEVLDNGSGFSPEVVAAIQVHLKGENTHHGLVNTLKRFELAFEETKWEVLSNKEQTLVRLSARLPKDEEKHQGDEREVKGR